MEEKKELESVNTEEEQATESLSTEGSSTEGKEVDSLNEKTSVEPVKKTVPNQNGANGIFSKIKNFVEKTPKKKMVQLTSIALAGVLAMRPKILVLDEPTAGLDPQGKKEILDLVTSLHKTMTPTIIMINHDMDEVARYANKVAVFDMGSVKYLLKPEQLAQKQDELVKMGLDIPTLAKLKNYLANKGIVLPDDCITTEKMVEYLADIKAKGGANV